MSGSYSLPLSSMGWSHRPLAASSDQLRDEDDDREHNACEEATQRGAEEQSRSVVIAEEQNTELTKIKFTLNHIHICKLFTI